MSSIPGELPRYLTAEVLLFTNRTQATHGPVIVQGNLKIDTPAIAAYGLLADTVLGRITATGELVPCRANATDGSEKPYALLHNNFHNLAGLPVGSVAPVSILVHGSPKETGWTESHIDSSWGARISQRLAAVLPYLRQIGILQVQPGYWSAPGAWPAGASLPASVDVAGLVEVSLHLNSALALISIYDQRSGTVIQGVNGTRWLLDKRTAVWLVDAGLATYI